MAKKKDELKDTFETGKKAHGVDNESPIKEVKEENA